MIFTCTATGIEVIELNYGEVFYNVSKRFEAPKSQKGKAVFENCQKNTSTIHERTLEHKTTEGKSWSHSVQFGVAGGLEIDLKPLGVGGHLGFEVSYSEEYGWSSSVLTEQTTTLKINEKVEPGTIVVAHLFLNQNEIRVPYTAKYRVTFSDGISKIIDDKGIMRNVIYSYSRSYDCVCSCNTSFGGCDCQNFRQT